MAAAITVIEVSPAPVASSFGPVDQHALDLRHRETQGQRPVRPPVDRSHLLVVPRDFLQQRPAHALERAAFDLISQAVRIRDRADIVRGDDPLRRDLAGVLVDFQFHSIRRTTSAAATFSATAHSNFRWL